jgi:hypothetical protein
MEVQVLVWPAFDFVRAVNGLSSDAKTRADAAHGGNEFQGLSVDQVNWILEPAGFPNLFYSDIGNGFISWNVSSLPIIYAYAWGTVSTKATLWLVDMFRVRLGTTTARTAAFKHLEQLALQAQNQP